MAILPSTIHHQLSTGYCHAEEILRAKAAGNNVNVRVRPEVNSEIVTQLSAGEKVIVLEKGGEWTKIAAPGHSRCWVYSECVSGAAIKTDSVNMRCGPGLAYPVLATLKKGTRVDIIEVFGEWTRIEPPVEFGVWVSSRYLEYKLQTQITHEESQEIEPVEVEPEIIEPVIVAIEVEGVELVTFAGRLEDLGVIINRPGTYKLVSGRDKWLCIIKSSEIDVNPYVNRVVRIEGVMLSRSSSWNVPVVELKRLSVIK